jgi:hypothetical protein
MQVGPIDQPDVAAFSKAHRLCRESARGHDEPAGSALGCHCAIELPHHVYPHLVGAPLFALNKELLAVLVQHEVDAAVSAAAPGLHHAITLKSKRLDNVIEGLFDELRAKRLTGALVLSFSPILLKGPAGCGKTRFARRLAEVLDLPVHALNLGGSIDAMAILGTNRGWSTAQPSPLLRPLLGGRATVLVIVDEVDKRGDLSRNNPPVEGALLPLLEPEEARRWRDGFLQVECDLRCLQWVMTCNDTTWLSAAFLSRVRVYEIRRPTRAELRSVVDFAVRDVETEWGLPAGVFSFNPTVMSREWVLMKTKVDIEPRTDVALYSSRPRKRLLLAGRRYWRTAPL